MTLLAVEPSVESVGSQTPRLSLVPKSVWNDAWQDATELAHRYGLDLDPWQQNVLKGWLGEREDGLWTCSQCGLSVPRQNGKGGVLEARELYGLLILKERIIHTAHEVRTAKDHFRRMKAYFESPLYPDLQKRVERISNTNGEEGIFLTNGAWIRFGSRSKNGGRGFAADLLVCDEAQHLSDDEIESLSPTLSTSENPQRIFTGTPPSPLMNGEVFTRVRRGAIDGTADRLSWIEWSADKDDPIDSHATWAKANPAFGYRLDVEKTEDDYNLMTEDGFSREKLGMWSSGSSSSVFDLEVWDSLVSTEVPKGPFALSVDMSSMMDRASVAVAGYNGDSIQVQIIESKKGTGWIAGTILDFMKSNRVLGVFIDNQSAAASKITDFRAKRIKVVPIGTREITHAAGMFLDRVNNETLLHVDQAPLNDAVANAQKRAVMDAFAWQKKNIDVDITPLVAASNAAHGLTLKRRPKTDETEERETNTKPHNRGLFF
ncbi:hypothetical protein [Streptomyces sp. NPDC059513]|uniref:hypothetical protein n=1 Tax=unclassified Streptomyces TaxID=2593676 RepID=UPI00369CD061